MIFLIKNLMKYKKGCILNNEYVLIEKIIIIYWFYKYDFNEKKIYLLISF